MPVGWTLQVEMVFSLLLPLMMWLTRRTHWSLLVLVSLWLIVTDWPVHFTLRYAFDFSLGIALYEERERLARLFDRVPGPLTGALLLFGLAIFTVPVYWIASFAWWAILPFGLGATILVAGAMHSTRSSRVLAARPMAFLGRISYSVYLLHFTVLLLCTPVLRTSPGLAMGLVFVAAVALLSCLLATASHRVVELPSIRLGNRLCVTLAKRTGVDEQVSRIAT